MLTAPLAALAASVLYFELRGLSASEAPGAPPGLGQEPGAGQEPAATGSEAERAFGADGGRGDSA